MKQTLPFQNRIHLFHFLEGKMWTFENITDACKYIDWIRSIGEVGLHFVETTIIFEDTVRCEKYDLILRDDYGDIVTIGQLYGEWRRLHKKKKRTYIWFRGFKRTTGNYYRRPHTTNERRQAYDTYDSYDDYGIVIRPRGQRNIHNLPDAWNDSIRIHQHTWKKTRKHQWR